MRRILLLITDLQIGGTPTVVRELAIRLSATGGVKIDVACLSPWGPVAEQIAEAGVGVTAFNADNDLSFPLVVWRLARLIRARQIDTVFSFLVHANMVAATAAPLCRNVRWLQSVQTTQPHPRWHWGVQSVAQQAAERVVVPSVSAARAAQTWASVPPEKLVVIPNAVDASNATTASDQAGDKRAPTRVGFVGRLDPIKRVQDLLAAMAFLQADTHLHLFGDGQQRSALEEESRRLGLSHRATFHGAISRPDEALKQMDVLVLPSEAEGFGLVLIEAMAAGVPVVATDVPGIRDVVQNGVTGILVPAGSPARLAAAIASVLQDAGLRDRLVAAGRADVRRRFSWDVVLPKYRALLGIVA